MKKILLLIGGFCWLAYTANAQNPTVIAQWSFSSNVDTIAKYPTACISQNAKMALFAQDTTAWPNTLLRPLSYTNGVTTGDYAATADHWQNGKNSKQWSVKFKTNFAKNITISSKQRSGGNTPGPRNWKVQAQISGGAWVDLTTVTVANDWTTGVITEVALPASFDSISKSIYIRWILVNDTSSSGTIVDSNGISKIDDIVIKGTYPGTSAIQDDENSNDVKFYPNPNNTGTLYFESAKNITLIRIFNSQGQMVSGLKPESNFNFINIQNFEPGLYFIKTDVEGTAKTKLQKFIVQ
jgi:hypothetical protein